LIEFVLSVDKHFRSRESGVLLGFNRIGGNRLGLQPPLDALRQQEHTSWWVPAQLFPGSSEMTAKEFNYLWLVTCQ
jgi:hypothetical protein